MDLLSFQIKLNFRCESNSPASDLENHIFCPYLDLSCVDVLASSHLEKWYIEVYDGLENFLF